MNASKIWDDLCSVRERAPLVHNITNYVVMNSTANALLAIGASPVMAHAREEVEDMIDIAASVGGALVINIGTLSKTWIEAMEAAMLFAADRKIPIVLDPVGAGATSYRTKTCEHLMSAAAPTVIRGNASEIMALLDASVKTKGVDSSQSSGAAEAAARKLAETHGCVVSVSGETDVITDGRTVFRISNGVPLMARVTGMGCAASALTGAFLAVNPNPLSAAAHAMAVMGIAGELAAEKADGPGTLQLHFLDTLHNLTGPQIDENLRSAS